MAEVGLGRALGPYNWAGRSVAWIPGGQGGESSQGLGHPDRCPVSRISLQDLVSGG